MNLPLLRRRLLAWFDKNRRDLPWRVDRDPYRIWVSEVMLQQTTVAAVAGRFEQFLKRFPTVATLAAADEQDVLHEWQGLGYYRRARNLHAAARQLAARHNGELPDNAAIWAQLPGVGRYILGAIMSQAFDRPMPIVEANSVRVLCRLFGQGGDPASGPVKKWLWHTAEAILPAQRTGDFNQAIMELGALVCTPTKPICAACPLARQCVARRDRVQESIPPRKKIDRPTEVREAALVIWRKGSVLLARRPATAARWSNMWEFPHGELREGESTGTGALRLLAELTGLEAELGEEWLTVRHGVTRFRITMTCVEGRYRAGRFASPFYVGDRWVAPANLAAFPVSSPQRRVAKAIIAGPRQRGLF